MIDIEEMMKRAQEASEAASKQLNESIEKSKKISEQMQADAEKAAAERAARQPAADEQTMANQQRQVEILGQMFNPEIMAQMAANEEMLQQMAEQKAAEATAGIMDQLFGEDMGVIAAALETLAMEEEDEDEEAEFDDALEAELYNILDEKMAQLAALPEPDPIIYTKDDPKWEQFGILLSGMIAKLNDHQLDCLDVEEHIPVMEQQIVSLVRRTWGINGRGELMDTLRYLTQEGYTLRYQIYCEANSPEELISNTDSEEEQVSLRRAWRFAQHYKTHYTPSFMIGWDIGRAAMLTRWGCYLGWLTEGEATGILWDLSQRVIKDLDNWREFAQSYLFGGLMWKLLCNDASAESYLSFLSDAATDLLAGRPEDDDGQWAACPWPEYQESHFSDMNRYH
ncbi:DUF1266 domain-containing protein [Dielma fastidiosa]|uniref:DUF1266 domain-containing protein n=1 Tax=Dielma fastidiosa TaxID=1034346 RepID=UPI000EF00118|nr:DUF1266 domain-containing protein [Dielma fastidiosa]HAH93648.1 hypothetical protein [Dielma fastidiosa]